MQYINDQNFSSSELKYLNYLKLCHYCPRLLIVDDHPVFLKGLRLTLEECGFFEVVAECSSGKETLELISKVKPDIVLSDLSLPDISGFELISKIRLNLPEVAIIVLSMYDREEVQNKVLAVGGTAFISKTAGSEKLLKLIGQVTMQQKRFSKTGKQIENNKFKEIRTIPTLTPREKEILMCISQGMQTFEIAQHLFITPQTIKNHLTSILKKLKVTDRTQAVLAAARLGWLTTTE